jgi:hypothetical protein
MTDKSKYGNHHYSFKKKTTEQYAMDIVKEIRNNQRLQKHELRRFIGGISKGKCPTILGDSLKFLFQDLEKQIYDYHLAVVHKKPLKQELANLINTASCLFMKLDHLKRK